MRQGLVEKSQEPMLMGSWLLPAVETRETRALAGAASCTGPVFTAFRNAFSSLTGGCTATNPVRFSTSFNALDNVAKPPNIAFETVFGRDRLTDVQAR